MLQRLQGLHSLPCKVSLITVIEETRAKQAKERNSHVLRLSKNYCTYWRAVHYHKKLAEIQCKDLVQKEIVILDWNVRFRHLTTSRWNIEHIESKNIWFIKLYKKLFFHPLVFTRIYRMYLIERSNCIIWIILLSLTYHIYGNKFRKRITSDFSIAYACSMQIYDSKNLQLSNLLLYTITKKYNYQVLLKSA